MTPATKGLLMVILGVVMAIAGTLAITGNEGADAMLTRVGAQTATNGALEMNGEMEDGFMIAADALDKGVQARLGSPDAFAGLISEEIEKRTDFSGTSMVISSVIGMLNTNYIPGQTEEEYLRKVKCISQGIRAAVIEHKTINENLHGK